MRTVFFDKDLLHETRIKLPFCFINFCLIKALVSKGAELHVAKPNFWAIRLKKNSRSYQ